MKRSFAARLLVAGLMSSWVGCGPAEAKPSPAESRPTSPSPAEPGAPVTARPAPESAQALCARGEARLGRKEYAEAVADFTAAAASAVGTDIAPGELRRIHLGRAEALAARGDFNGADAAFDRAAMADPSRADAVATMRARVVGQAKACGDCDGLGFKIDLGNDTTPFKCGGCGGRGTLVIHTRVGTNRYATQTVPCGHCKGSGSDRLPGPHKEPSDSRCPTCSGKGTVRVKPDDAGK